MPSGQSEMSELVLLNSSGVVSDLQEEKHVVGADTCHVQQQYTTYDFKVNL